MISRQRKTATYLNRLRHDVDDVLAEIQQAGVDVDSATFDLSKVLACDLPTQDDEIRVLYDTAQDANKQLYKLLNKFMTVRDRYLEFF